VFWLAPRARFRLYTRLGDYWAFLLALATGRATSGNDVERLEREIGARYGMPYALCVAQGRVGIYLAVKVLIKPGQTVVMSPYTIADVVNMVICAGGVPMFADIDRPTTNVTAETIAPLINDRTGAVLITHLHGLSCDIDPIVALCKARGLPLIEDAAQAFGARVHGQPVGTFGDIGVFSFGLYKNVTAFYGGAIVTRDETLDRAMRAELGGAPGMSIGTLGAKVLKAFVTDVVTAPPLFTSIVYWIFRFGHLHDIRAINKFVMVELDTSRKRALPGTYLRRFLPVQARMVMRQLPHIDTAAAERIRYAKLYHEGLRGLPGLITPPFRDDGTHVYNYFAIQHPRRQALVRWAMLHRRDMAVQHLKNCAGLSSFAPEYRDCPNAEQTAAQTVLLPNYPGYGEASVRRNIDVIREFCRHDSGQHG